MKQLNMEKVKESLQYHNLESFKALQVAVYVMCGGGLLGRLAAEEPADFYIDDRVGRLPYPGKVIYQAVQVLKLHAEQLGLDPHNCPAMVHFHAAGAF